MVSLFFLKFLPKRLFSRLIGRVADLYLPKVFLVPIIRLFIRIYKIDKKKIGGSLSDYETLNQFLARNVAPGELSIDFSEYSIISPVSGKVLESGKITKSTLIQAKGIDYPLASLLGDDELGRISHLFEGGNFVTTYLRPSDPHNVYAPLDGAVKGYVYLPGRLESLCEASVKKRKNLYLQNERLAILLETRAGFVAVVMVGAFCTGKLVLTPGNITFGQFSRKSRKIFSSPLRLDKSEHLGRFLLGSTVILIFQKDRVRLEEYLKGLEIEYGTQIGSII